MATTIPISLMGLVVLAVLAAAVAFIITYLIVETNSSSTSNWTIPVALGAGLAGAAGLGIATYYT